MRPYLHTAREAWMLLCVWLVLPVLANGQEAVSSRPPKIQDKIFNRPVLYPERMIVNAEGIPQAIASGDGIRITVRGFRGTSFLYFQVDIANDSNTDFTWQATDYRLTDDRGFAIAGISPYEASVALARELNKPPPPPPPSRRTSESVTTGRIDQYGNIDTRTTTTTEPDAYASGYALGRAFGTIFNRGRAQREEAFIQDLAAFAYAGLTIRPSERQRVYLSNVYVKSKYYELTIAEPFRQVLRFSVDKPKGIVPIALGTTVATDTASTPVATPQPSVVNPANEPAQTPAVAVAPAPTPAVPAAPIPHQAEPATLLIKSSPEGAEITIDGKFVGSTPSTLQLAPGDHEIIIEKKGGNVRRVAGGEVTVPNFRAWRRTLSVSPGSTLTLDATLEPVQ